MKATTVFLGLLLFAATAYAATIQGSSPNTRYEGDCCSSNKFGISFKTSGRGISPQLVWKRSWCEVYFGASFTATSDEINASVEKYREYDLDTFLAETDSYWLDLAAFVVQPELGIRSYLTSAGKNSPYIDLGFFLMVPFLTNDYHEKFVKTDSNGTVYEIYENRTEVNPGTKITDIYQLGVNVGFGVSYEPNANISLFGEIQGRLLITGADIEYNLLSERQREMFYGKQDFWKGGGTLYGGILGGNVGVIFYF